MNAATVLLELAQDQGPVVVIALASLIFALSLVKMVLKHARGDETEQ